MSNPFNPGDRVRVVGLENETPSTETAAAILRGEVDGEVTDFTEKWTVANFGGQNYHVPTKNLQRVSPRRTFEEVAVALANDPLFRSYNCDLSKGDINRESAHFVHYKSERMFTLLRCGHFWTETQFVDLSADQLAAIAAACTEIAANYEAEHGKEEA